MRLKECFRSVLLFTVQTICAIGLLAVYFALAHFLWEPIACLLTALTMMGASAAYRFLHSEGETK